MSNHSIARQWEGEQRWSYTPQDLASGAAVALKLCISSLHSGVRFGLLCCQPEPVPGSLPARIPQFTLQYPCGPLALLRRAVHRHSSTCPGAKGFTTIARWHRSKAPTERRNIRCGRGPSANREAVAKVQEGERHKPSVCGGGMPEMFCDAAKLRRRELNPGLPRDSGNINHYTTADLIAEMIA